MIDIALLRKVRSLFKDGENLTKWFSSKGIVMNEKHIELIYDLQAGSYTSAALANPSHTQRFASEVASSILRLDGWSEIKNILDCGTGEGTSLIPLIEELKFQGEVLGFDISISRASWAASNSNVLNNIHIFVADLSRIPLADDSIDLVLTTHSLEPNGGKEQLLVNELARVSSRYVVMVEPDFEGASKEQQIRMDELGYIKGLESAIAKANLTLIEKVRMEENINPVNKASVWICEKLTQVRPDVQTDIEGIEKTPKWLDPLSRAALRAEEGWFKSDDGICYPSINRLPLLRPDDGFLYLSPTKRQ